MKLLFVIALILSATTAQDVNLKQVRCLVCRTVVEEFKDEVNKIDPSKQIEIGQYRLDSKGNTFQKKVPLSMSHVHLSDILESTCKKMEDYVRATYKSSGKLTLLKLMTGSGVNSLLSQVDIIQDGDLNKSLEYFCRDIVNEHEDAFIEAITKKEKNAKAKICTEIAEYCENFEDLLDDDEDETDNENDKDESNGDFKSEL